MTRNPSARFVLCVERIACDASAMSALGLLQPLRAALGEDCGCVTELPSDDAAATAEPPTTTTTIEMLQLESHGDCVALLPPGAIALATSGVAHAC